MGPPLRSAVAVVGKGRTTQRHPGGRLGGQNKPDTLEAHPRSRVHCPIRTLPQVVVLLICQA